MAFTTDEAMHKINAASIEGWPEGQAIAAVKQLRERNCALDTVSKIKMRQQQV
jgi:hypothetical protein